MEEVFTVGEVFTAVAGSAAEASMAEAADSTEVSPAAGGGSPVFMAEASLDAGVSEAEDLAVEDLAVEDLGLGAEDSAFVTAALVLAVVLVLVSAFRGGGSVMVGAIPMASTVTRIITRPTLITTRMTMAATILPILTMGAAIRRR